MSDTDQGAWREDTCQVWIPFSFDGVDFLGQEETELVERFQGCAYDVAAHQFWTKYRVHRKDLELTITLQRMLRDAQYHEFLEEGDGYYFRIQGRWFNRVPPPRAPVTAP